MVETYELNNYITLLRNDTIVNNSNPIYFNQDINSISLQVNLKGESNHKSLICDYKGRNLQNHTCLDLLNNYEGMVNILPKGRYQFIEILIKKEYLDKILPLNNLSHKVFDFFSSNQNGLTFHKNKTNLLTKRLAQNIFDIPFNGNLEKLFLESKTLELLYIEFNNIFNQKDKKSNIVKFSSQDKEAIYNAKDILSQNLSNPPSIKELSKMVAINELKLKVGFHKYFNQTPYKLSVEYRLQKAYSLLEKSEYNINEISFEIGYKYVQSFSNAFYEKFGIRPKEVSKKRHYY